MTLKSYSLTVVFALFSNTLLASAVAALTMEYQYRGNNFVELEGITGLFSFADQVSERAENQMKRSTWVDPVRKCGLTGRCHLEAPGCAYIEG